MDMLQCREHFENINYDKNYIKIMNNVDKIDHDSTEIVSVIFENAKESSCMFLNNLKDNNKQLANTVRNWQPEVEVIKEITEAVKFMDHFITCEVPTLKSASIKTISIDSKISFFEVLCQIFIAISAGYQKVQCCVHPNRVSFVKRLFLGFNLQEKESNVRELVKPTANFCTLIVTEFCDIEAASDQIVSSWNHMYAPWTVRTVFVQESISEKLVELLQRKLKPLNEVFLNDKHFNDSFIESMEKLEKMGLKIIQNIQDVNVVKATLVQNTTREFMGDNEHAVPIINLNLFRTIKEFLTLVNADLKDSASIWSENISVAFELANGLKCTNIWINCNEIFNPKFAYKFGDNVFGEMLGDSKSKALFESKAHFQTIGLENGKFKTITIPFGVTFGN